MLELNIFLKSSDKPNIRTREKHQEIINTNFPISKTTLIPQIPSSIPKAYKDSNYLSSNIVKNPIYSLIAKVFDPIGCNRVVCSLKIQMEVNQ